MLNASLCDYSDAYILVEGIIAVVGEGTNAAANAAVQNNKKVFSKNWAPFISYISKINNAEVDSAKDPDIVMPMYKLLQYNKNYSKASDSLWQNCRDEPDDIIKKF